MTWTPERRAAQAQRMRALRATLTREQLSEFGSRPKKRQARYNVENLHRNVFLAKRAGRTGWAPERRAAQARRLATVRPTGEAAAALARRRESIKRHHEARSKAAKAAWTPERRRANSARMQRQSLQMWAQPGTREFFSDLIRQTNPRKAVSS